MNVTQMFGEVFAIFGGILSLVTPTFQGLKSVRTRLLT